MTRETDLAQDSDRLASEIESLLFVAGQPVPLLTLAATLRVSENDILVGLEILGKRLDGGIRLQMDHGSAQLVTAAEFTPAVHRFLGFAKPPPLSRAMLETLTVVAYQQPVTRAEIEAARGVNSDRAVHSLLARGLIVEKGQREVLGRPTEFCTSFGFLEYFGLHSLDDLPELPLPQVATASAEDVGLREELEHTDEQETATRPATT